MQLLGRQFDTHMISTGFIVLPYVRLRDPTVGRDLIVMPCSLQVSQVTRRLSIEPNLQCRHSSGSAFRDDPACHHDPHPCAFPIPGKQVLMILPARHVHTFAIINRCYQAAFRPGVARGAVICGHIAPPESRTRLIRSLNMIFRRSFQTIGESASASRLLPHMADRIPLFMRPGLMSARMFAVLRSRCEEGNKQEQRQTNDTSHRIGSKQAYKNESGHYLPDGTVTLLTHNHKTTTRGRNTAIIIYSCSLL